MGLNDERRLEEGDRGADFSSPTSSFDLLVDRQRSYFWKTGFEKNCFFCVGELAEYGSDQQRLLWYVIRLWDMVCS